MCRICPKESKEEKEEADESSAAPGEEGEGDSEKPATDEENSAMREKMIFGRKKVCETGDCFCNAVIIYYCETVWECQKCHNN